MNTNTPLSEHQSHPQVNTSTPQSEHINEYLKEENRELGKGRFQSQPDNPHFCSPVGDKQQANKNYEIETTAPTTVVEFTTERLAEYIEHEMETLVSSLLPPWRDTWEIAEEIAEAFIEGGKVFHPKVKGHKKGLTGFVKRFLEYEREEINHQYDVKQCDKVFDYVSKYISYLDNEERRIYADAVTENIIYNWNVNGYFDGYFRWIASTNNAAMPVIKIFESTAELMKEYDHFLQQRT